MPFAGEGSPTQHDGGVGMFGEWGVAESDDDLEPETNSTGNSTADAADNDAAEPAANSDGYDSELRMPIRMQNLYVEHSTIEHDENRSGDTALATACSESLTFCFPHPSPEIQRGDHVGSGCGSVNSKRDLRHPFRCRAPR
jgi:hypothetical protein